MNDLNSLGKILIYLGIGVIILGGIVYLVGDKLSWPGHLPGDIKIEKENFKFYFPITTMILISLIINIIIRIIKYFF